MQNSKRACLVFVPSTAGQREGARQRLEADGYIVCEVEVELAEAVAAKDGEEGGLPSDLKACIDQADVCIFLIPEQADLPSGMSGGIGVGNAGGKRVVVAICGDSTEIPQEVDELADAIVKIGSEDFIPAVDGKEIWDVPDRSSGTGRKTSRVKCQ